MKTNVMYNRLVCSAYNHLEFLCVCKLLKRTAKFFAQYCQ